MVGEVSITSVQEFTYSSDSGMNVSNQVQLLPSAAE